MDKFPVEPKKRKIVELVIRIVDIIVYVFVFVSGIYALFLTPDSVNQELAGYEWLIPIWAGFLLVGGAFGFAGRVSTRWILEPPAALAGMVGAAIYVVVLVGLAAKSTTALVAMSFVIIAFLCLGRRYLELQLFGSDPTHRTFKLKFQDAVERRSPNYIYKS